jgi:transcriptional regulator with XRE-family HTH domain
MSQEDLAVALAAQFGTTPDRERRTLVNNETGRNAPQLRRLQAIAEATGKPLDFFAVDGGGDADGDDVRFREAVA